MLVGGASNREYVMSAFKGADQKRPLRQDFIPPQVSRQPARVIHKSHVAEIEDADFVVIGKVQPNDRHYSQVRNDNHCATPRAIGNADPFLIKLGSFAYALENALQKLPFKLFAGFVAGSVLLAFLAAYLSGGHPAAITSPGGVVISDISASFSDSNGLRVLEIRGMATNANGQNRPAPRMIATYWQDSGRAEKTSFALPVEEMLSGVAIPFTLRVPQPRGKLPNVTVSVDVTSL